MKTVVSVSLVKCEAFLESRKMCVGFLPNPDTLCIDLRSHSNIYANMAYMECLGNIG